MNAGEFIAENKSFMVFRMDFFFIRKLDYLENMLNTFSVTGGIMIKILGRNLFKFFWIYARAFLVCFIIKTGTVSFRDVFMAIDKMGCIRYHYIQYVLLKNFAKLLSFRFYRLVIKVQ